VLPPSVGQVTALGEALGPTLRAQLGLALRVQLGLALRVQLGLALRVQLGLALVSEVGVQLGLGEALRVQLGLPLRVQLGLALVPGPKEGAAVEGSPPAPAPGPPEGAAVEGSPPVRVPAGAKLGDPLGRALGLGEGDPGSLAEDPQAEDSTMLSKPTASFFSLVVTVKPIFSRPSVYQESGMVSST
jgi:hypothetical protein